LHRQTGTDIAKTITASPACYQYYQTDNTYSRLGLLQDVRQKLQNMLLLKTVEHK